MERRPRGRIRVASMALFGLALLASPLAFAGQPQLDQVAASRGIAAGELTIAANVTPAQTSRVMKQLFGSGRYPPKGGHSMKPWRA